MIQRCDRTPDLAMYRRTVQLHLAQSLTALFRLDEAEVTLEGLATDPDCDAEGRAVSVAALVELHMSRRERERSLRDGERADHWRRTLDGDGSNVQTR